MLVDHSVLYYAVCWQAIYFLIQLGVSYNIGDSGTDEKICCYWLNSVGRAAQFLYSLCKPTLEYYDKRYDVTAKISTSLFGPVIKSK